MNTQFLTNFLIIVQEGNLSKAADKLFITQPTLTRQLAEMEEQLGVQLFERGKRQMSLTEAGLIFEKRAKEILRLIELTNEEVSGKTNNLVGLIRIGNGESIASELLSELIEKFIRLNPNVKFEIFTGNGDDIKEKIDQNQIDCGILLEPIEVAKYNTFRIPLQERWGVILPTHHPLVIKGEVDGIDLLNLPLIGTHRSIVMQEIAIWLNVDINDINFVVHHNLLTNSLMLAKHDVGYPFTIEGALSIRPQEGLSFVPLVPNRVSTHVFVYKKNVTFNSTVLSFVDFVSKELETIH